MDKAVWPFKNCSPRTNHNKVGIDFYKADHLLDGEQTSLAKST